MRASDIIRSQKQIFVLARESVLKQLFFKENFKSNILEKN